MGDDKSLDSGDLTHQTLRRFALNVALAMLMALMFVPEARVTVTGWMLTLASMVTAAFAVVARERINDRFLNRWDETLGYLAIALLCGAFAGGAAVPVEA